MVALLTAAEKGRKEKPLTPANSGAGIDPFGRIFNATGSFKDTNKWRFSSKITEDDWGVVYFGYRYYQPDTSRWLSRDPVAENFAPNLYVFLDNSVMCFIDILGREPVSTERKVAISEGLHNAFSRMLNPLQSPTPTTETQPGQQAARRAASARVVSHQGSSSSGRGASRSRLSQSCCVADIVGFVMVPEVAAVALSARTDAARVGSELVSSYPGYTEGDLINAYRHCLLACRLTKWMRANVSPNPMRGAWAIEECHEAESTDPVDTHIDRHNNRVGNLLGMWNTGSCASRCRQAMDNDLLLIVPER